MMTLSTISAVLGSIFLLLVGWGIGKLMGKSKTIDIMPKLAELEKEKGLLTKAQKKDKGQIEQLRKKAESWKHEFHDLTQESQLKSKGYKSQIDELNGLMKSHRDDHTKLKVEKDRGDVTVERLQKELEKLKEKYKRDVADGKEWITARDKAEREIKDLTAKLEKQTLTANEYQKKYAKQAEEISKIRVMEREMRQLNAKVANLEKDCTYWEKKHYDTHHELASLKIKQEAVNTKFAELIELRKGDEILRSNLMDQIQEFKSKFVDVNNKYREMMSNN